MLEARDHGTHTLFVAEVTEAVVLDKSAESVTYERYLSEIKPKTAPVCSTVQKGYVCKICGYVYEGETLPADFHSCEVMGGRGSDFQWLVPLALANFSGTFVSRQPLLREGQAYAEIRRYGIYDATAFDEWSENNNS